jgi:TP901 family phage tail tape measure protein
MSKKITSQDIFDDKIFDKIKSDANSFKTTLENLKTQFSAILGQQQQFLQQKVSFASAADLKKLNDVLEQNKALRQSLIAIQNKLNQVQNQGASTTSKLTKEKVREAEARKRKRKELVDEIALEEKQNVSLNKLLASSRKLRRERADLDLATAKGRQRLQEINVQLDKNNALIRKNSDALKKQRLNVGNYSSALGSAVGKLRNLAGAFGLVAGAAGVVSVFRNAIGVFRTFEQVQTDLASILQKTREETVALSDAAKDLGATTFFTATEVSKLQVELAKLGFDTQQIVDSEEAILNLAAAFSIDLPQAAKVVASTLNGFQLEADESARVADVLAKSFAKSALDIEKFEVAISKVAPIASGLGVDIETTTAALGKLVSAGFDASTAGTQFRNILLKLSDPSSELANTLGLTVDSSEDLVQAFKTLNKEQLSIAKAQGLIDVRSVALLKSLSDNADGVQELREELEGAAGTAEDIASNQLKTLNGSFRLLSSAYEGFILSVEDGTGAIGEFLKSVVQVATGVFNLLTGTEKARESFSQLSPEIQALAQNIVNFFTVLTDTVKTLFEYRRAIIAAFIALKSYQALLVLSTTALGLYQKATVLARIASIAFSGGLKGVTRALKLLNLAIKANPIGLLASALALLGSVLVTFLADWLLFGESTEDVNENLDKSAEKIENIEEKVKNLKKELKDFRPRVTKSFTGS